MWSMNALGIILRRYSEEGKINICHILSPIGYWHAVLYLRKTFSVALKFSSTIGLAESLNQ